MDDSEHEKVLEELLELTRISKRPSGGVLVLPVRMATEGWSEEALIRYVLGRFTAEEETAIQESITLVSDVLECIILEGLDAAMNRYN